MGVTVNVCVMVGMMDGVNVNGAVGRVVWLAVIVGVA